MRRRALLLLATSCALEGYERGDAPLVASANAEAASCALARPPTDAPPDVASTAESDFVVAFRTVTWPATVTPEHPDVARIGFDRDGRCTCSEGFRTSCLIAADAPLENHCDDPQGRDNNLGVAFAPVTLLTGDGDFGVHLSSAIGAGLWGHLLEVRGYNGKRDDARVWVASHPALTLGAIGGPTWEGGDVWPVARDSFADAGRIVAPQPRSVDPDAFVVDGTLVAHLPVMRLRIETDFVLLDLRLEEVDLVARVEATSVGHVLRDGVISAALTERDAFAALDAFRYGPDKDQFFCAVPDFAYDLLRGAVCRAFDLRVSDDDTTAACDALSVGLGFSAEPAAIGPLADPPEPVGSCDPGTEPKDDRCKY